MKRLHVLLGLVVIAAVMLLPSAPAGLGAGAPPISLASILIRPWTSTRGFFRSRRPPFR